MVTETLAAIFVGICGINHPVLVATAFLPQLYGAPVGEHDQRLCPGHSG